MMRRQIGILAILLIAGTASAQNLRYRHFSTNEGLPNPQIYITKTGSDGSLWIATDNGLSRFDGNHFTNFYPKQTVGTNYVLDMDSLPGAQMLVNVYKGGLCLIRNDSVIPVTLIIDKACKNPARPFNPTRLYSLTYDPENHCMWVISANRDLFRMVYTNGQLQVFPGDTALGKCFFVYNARISRRVLFATANGLFTWKQTSGLQPVVSATGYPVKRVFEKENGTLIFSAPGKLVVLPPAPAKSYMLQYTGGALDYEAFLYDEYRQQLWIPGQQGGIYVFSNMSLNTPYLYLLQGITPNYLHADARRNIWCSTYGGGLYLFQQTHILNYGEREGLTDGYITHIGNSATGSLLISCLRTFYRFNINAGTFTQLLRNQPTDPFNKSLVLRGKEYFANRGQLLNEKGENVYQARVTVLYSMLLLPPDTLLMSPYYGVVSVSQKLNRKFDNIFSPTSHVYALLAKGDSVLYGTSGGLFIRSPAGVTVYDAQKGLGDGYIHAMLVHNDSIYCGTRTGLYVIDPAGKITPCWKDKLADEDVGYLCADNRGGIWIGTQKGLYLQWQNRFFHLDRHDGFVANEVTAIGVRGDKLLVGTTQGLSVADLPQTYATLTDPVDVERPQLKSITVNGRELPLPANFETLNLGPGQNNLTLHIAAIQFMPEPLTVLEYSLDNGNTWTEVVNREINLRSLGYGRYTLIVRNRYRNDLAWRYMAPFHFRIRLPLYRNPWFIIGTSIALSALLMFVYARFTRNRRRREKQQLALKKQMLDLEQKAMAALLNPHFVFNAINSINYYIHNGEEEKYTRLLTDLSKLIRLNLNNTYKGSVTLKSELEIVTLYVAFEKHRFIRHPLEFEIIDRSHIPAIQIKIPSMIIQPFVENAIWHGLLPRNGGKVWIEIDNAPNDYIQVAIHDNGVGIAAGKEKGTGNEVRGIHLIRERIAASNQLNKYPVKLSFREKDKNGGEGFCVQLLFPLNQE